MFFLIFILSTFSFALIGTYYLRKTKKLERRIQQFITEDTKAVKLSNQETTVKKLPFKDIIQKLSKNIKTTEDKQSKIEQQLESAGIPINVEEFIAVRLVLFAFVISVSIFAGVHLLLSILLGFVAWKIPSIYIRKKKEARIVACAGQLPQTLEMMANAMKTGFSFMQAMQLVSTEIPNPTGIEFQRTIKEINLGVSAETAFENLLQRLPNKDLEIVISAILIQRTTGGNLANILEIIHETISERVRMKDELRALTSQGRMSALVITLLPVALGIILSVIDPDYFSPMFSHPLGLVLLGAGVVSGFLGWIFIQKVVTIEV